MTVKVNHARGSGPIPGPDEKHVKLSQPSDMFTICHVKAPKKYNYSFTTPTRVHLQNLPFTKDKRTDSKIIPVCMYLCIQGTMTSVVHPNVDRVAKSDRLGYLTRQCVINKVKLIRRFVVFVDTKTTRSMCLFIFKL